MISNKKYAQQKAALTRAVNSGDRVKVETAVRKAVQEWEAAGGPWPDDWHRWNRALNDMLPFHSQVDIENFR